jgi:hypothetical protein
MTRSESLNSNLRFIWKLRKRRLNPKKDAEREFYPISNSIKQLNLFPCNWIVSCEHYSKSKIKFFIVRKYQWMQKEVDLITETNKHDDGIKDYTVFVNHFKTYLNINVILSWVP